MVVLASVLLEEKVRLELAAEESRRIAEYIADSDAAWAAFEDWGTPNFDCGYHM